MQDGTGGWTVSVKRHHLGKTLVRFPNPLDFEVRWGLCLGNTALQQNVYLCLCRQIRVISNNGWKPGWAEKPDYEADRVFRLLPANNNPIYDESGCFHIAELEKFVASEALKPVLFLLVPDNHQYWVDFFYMKPICTVFKHTGFHIISTTPYKYFTP